MRFSTFIPLAVVALLPICESIFLYTTGTTATAGTLALGTGGGAAVAAGAVAVAGALLVGGVVAAALASRRGKRDTATIDGQCIPMQNPDLFITLAASSDGFGCGMRLVCELEATPDEQLSPDEKLILGLFGRQIKPTTFSEMTTSKAGFQYAAFIGANAKNVSECANVFDQCPLDRLTIMEHFNAAK